MLPFGTNTAIRIGDKIISNDSNVEGIEGIPSGQIANACAVYHDGFYKLSYASAGMSYNDRQFWLDINNIRQDEDGFWGPWYGPMIGMNVSCFFNQAGPGDSGDLLGGEANSATGGFVYDLDKAGTFGDSGSSIDCMWKTFLFDFQTPHLMKTCHEIEFEFLDTSAGFTVDLYNPSYSILATETFTISSEQAYYNEDFYNVDFYYGENLARELVEINPSAQFRRLSLLLSHGSASDDFQIYSVGVKALEEGMGFEPES